LKRIKQLFDLYIHSSIHVALAVTSFAGITFIHFGREISTETLLFIGLCTIPGYNLTRFDSLNDLLQSRQNLFTAILTVCCLAGGLWMTFHLPTVVVVLAMAAGIVTLLYNGLFSHERTTLREVTGIKIFLIALVWTAVTVLMPAAMIEEAEGLQIFAESVQRFFFVIVLTIPFDIRDVRMDTYQLATIPQVIGIRNARYLGIMLLFLVLVPETFLQFHNDEYSLIMLSICILTGISILNTGVRQHRYFASFWIEGIPILWFAILLLSS
jgi:hypothetical protein